MLDVRELRLDTGTAMTPDPSCLSREPILAEDTVTQENVENHRLWASFVEVTPQTAYQQLLLPHQEAKAFMQKWLFYLLNHHLRFKIDYKTLLKDDSDQCRVKCLRRSQGRSGMTDGVI